MMGSKKKYEGLLCGEISATTQFNCLPTPMLKLLERPNLHEKAFEWRDYPLTAINLIIQTRAPIFK